MVPAELINAAFQSMLGRSPESDAVVQQYMKLPSMNEVISSILNSPEFAIRFRPGPLWNFHSSFDPIKTVIRHENPSRTSIDGHRVNYIGVAVNVKKFFPSLKLENIVEPAPLPSNWHADIAEFAAVLRSIEHAGPHYSMIELGCGWGCWMNIAGVAAKRTGRTVSLIGVEGDEGHVAFATEAMATNGFSSDETQLFRGIAAARDGLAFFPKQGQSGKHWGLEPVFGTSEKEAQRLRASRKFDEIKMVPLREIIGNKKEIDLLHIDIQGGEVDFIKESLDVINKYIKYIVVGTHSRSIDGKIIDILLKTDCWELEIERQCLFSIDDGILNTRIDGVQGWRNTNFKSHIK
jgi:FkbM family methyltransferase